jgi:hypothetical protein
LKQAVRGIRVTFRKQQLLFSPSTAYSCRFGEKTKVAFIIVCHYQRAHKNESLPISAIWKFPACGEKSQKSVCKQHMYMTQIYGDLTAERVGDSFCYSPRGLNKEHVSIVKPLHVDFCGRIRIHTQTDKPLHTDKYHVTVSRMQLNGELAGKGIR